MRGGTKQPGSRERGAVSTGCVTVVEPAISTVPGNIEPRARVFLGNRKNAADAAQVGSVSETACS